MMAATNTMQAIDSLVANEFSLEIDGEEATGIFSVAEFVPFQLDDNGNRVFSPVKIAKMVQRDGNNTFNTWLRETTAAGADKPTRTVSIVAIDDGVETRRWTLNGAWISRVHYSPFDTGSFEMIEEVFTVHYESIDESWPATD